MRLVLEVLESRVDAEKGELALNYCQVRARHVAQYADQEVGRVVPALARGPGAVTMSVDLRTQGELEAGAVACQAHEQEPGLLQQRGSLQPAGVEGP